MSERAANPAENGAGSAPAAPNEPAQSGAPGTATPPRPETTQAPAQAPTASSDDDAGRAAVPTTPSPSSPPSPAPAPAATSADVPPAPPEAAAPTPDAGQGVLSGRLSPGVLAGAALVGLLLIAAPFGVATLGEDRPSSRSPEQGREDLAADLPQDDEKPGFVPVPAESSASPTARTRTSATPGSGSKPLAAAHDPATPGPTGSRPRTSEPDGGKAGAKSSTRKNTKRSTRKDTQRGSGSGSGANPQSAPQSPAPRYIVSKLNGRCVDIRDWQAVPGAQLQMWDCVPQDNQRWTFPSDGTVRALGMCLTTAWQSGDDGSPVQLAQCSGSPQQKWVLNSHEDLVNPAADKCADIIDANPQNGAHLQLWSCNGKAHQKWVSR